MNNMQYTTENRSLTSERLVEQNQKYRKTGGVSSGNHSLGFVPAFRDVEERILIMGDRDKLKQVIINLLLNACQATTQGERVHVRIHADEASGFAQIEVRNPGVIPEELLSRITEPFVTNKQAGTGLGLAIAKRIIDAHEGELEIELSTPEEVCVRVSLPLTVYTRHESAPAPATAPSVQLLAI